MNPSSCSTHIYSVCIFFSMQYNVFKANEEKIFKETFLLGHLKDGFAQSNWLFETELNDANCILQLQVVGPDFTEVMLKKLH